MLHIKWKLSLQAFQKCIVLCGLIGFLPRYNAIIGDQGSKRLWKGKVKMWIFLIKIMIACDISNESSQYKLSENIWFNVVLSSLTSLKSDNLFNGTQYWLNNYDIGQNVNDWFEHTKVMWHIKWKLSLQAFQKCIVLCSLNG